MVKDPVARAYLDEVDGIWADLVVSECTFLEEGGYTLRPIFFHQNGDAITYSGPRGYVHFDFIPVADDIGAEASLHGGFLAFEGTLDLLAQIHAPHEPRPPKWPLTHDTIERLVRYWADALRAAPEML
jgi:hypothetical protein